MSLKKTLGAVLACFVVLVAGNYLIHTVWLSKDYMATKDIWRPPDAMMHRLWALLASDFVVAVGAALIYARGVEAKPWVGQGMRFGILLALVAAIPQSLTEYAVYPIPHMLAVKWMIGEGLLSIVLGLVLAAICQPKKPAAAS